MFDDRHNEILFSCFTPRASCTTKAKYTYIHQDTYYEERSNLIIIQISRQMQERYMYYMVRGASNNFC